MDEEELDDELSLQGIDEVIFDVGDTKFMSTPSLPLHCPVARRSLTGRLPSQCSTGLLCFEYLNNPSLICILPCIDS